MFSQEVVSRLTDSHDQPAAVSADDHGDWDTAERYYLNGRFRYIASVDPTVRVEQVASHTRADDTPAVFISTIVEAEEPEIPSDQVTLPAAVEPVDPPGVSPIAPSPEPIAITSEESFDTPESEPSIFDTLVQDDEPAEVEADVVVQAEPEQQIGSGEIDVLPLPLSEPTQEMAGFGVFSDEQETPESDVAQSESGSVSERELTAVDPYDIPAGHSMRYLDPMDLVRQRAIEKAENRRRRIEARKWMGYDPLRPAVNAGPYMTMTATRPAILVIPIVILEDR